MVLICGIPNAGKTTFSGRFQNVIHYDHLRMTSRDRIDYILRAASDPKVCVDGVFGKRKLRERIAAIAGDKVCIWLDTPVEVCLEREQNYRKRPEGLVLRYARMFEPPTLEEGWDVIMRITEHECHYLKREA